MLSLTYNHHLNQSYVADVALEPIIWIVDNYAHFLGRVSKHSALECKLVKVVVYAKLPIQSTLFRIILQTPVNKFLCFLTRTLAHAKRRQDIQLSSFCLNKT